MAITVDQIAFDPKADSECNLFAVGDDGVVYQYNFIDENWISLSMRKMGEAE